MRQKYTLEYLKENYIGKTFGYITITDVVKYFGKISFLYKCKCGTESTRYYLEIINNQNKILSCGCYQKSEEYSKLQKEYNSQHKDKLLGRGKKFSEWCRNNPEKIRSASQGYKQWCKNNPDKVKEKSEKVKQHYIDHPEAVKVHSDRMRARYNCNKNQFLEYSKIANDARREQKRLARINSNLTELVAVIHPDYLNDLLSGKLDTHNIIKTKCPKCGCYDDHRLNNVFVISRSKFKNNSPPLCINCRNNLTSSSYEIEIADYISTFYDGELIRNSRDIISPLELDLFYPEKKIAIEFNGDYWHSEQRGKEKNYHFNKFKLCKEKGIRLISIFEHDWVLKNDKVRSTLKSALSQKNRIYARGCICKKLDSHTKSEFINKYHFNSDVQTGNISYGLYYNNELISVMSFGKLRYRNLFNKSNERYELIRFVTKDDSIIIGGASKLFSHFINDYNPDYIVCYSDNDFFDGEVYNKLGFKLKSLGENSIDYVWVNNEECLSRYQTMPYKLLNKFPQYQYQYYISDRDRISIEKYIMEDLGYNRVYRCGNSVWEYRRHKNDKK
jgi:hypothetical protein